MSPQGRRRLGDATAWPTESPGARKRLAPVRDDFERALGVVCDNFDSPLADQFARTLREVEFGLPRREALHNLKRRMEVPELSNFVLTLTQADALGMPIGRVSKVSAEEMRKKRQRWAREKAAKLAVKILSPLVLFFPSTFAVLPGPAAADIGTAFSG